MENRTLLVVSGWRGAKCDTLLTVDELKLVFTSIELVVRNSGKVFIMHGGCPTGVDAFVERTYASITLPMPADWDKLGKAAGPIRNRWMVGVGKAFDATGQWNVRAIAFPKPGFSRGTYGFVKEWNQWLPRCNVVEL